MCLCDAKKENVHKPWSIQMIACTAKQCIFIVSFQIINTFCDWCCCCCWIVGCRVLAVWIGWWGEWLTDGLIVSIDVDECEDNGPIVLTNILKKTVFHFGSSQLHERFVEANVHETIRMVEDQSTASHTQTAPLRAKSNTKVMIINWSINRWLHTKK